MTKAQEIAALNGFIQSLPQDSYLRPWLVSVLPQVESEIRSDFPVSPSIEDPRRECAAMLAQATARKNELQAIAEREADRMIKEAQQKRDKVFNLAYSGLQSALRAIGAD